MQERDEQEERANLTARIWRSMVRGPLVPRTDRERKWVVFNTLVLHLRPIRVLAPTLRYTHTFGLGGSALVLFLILAATGCLLMFAYEPAPGKAYDSVVSMQEEILFGRLVRGAHYWSANLLILVALAHLLRVFFTGGYHGPRQFNWLVGLALLACLLASNFTGYLLPWDQLSFWAITISTGMVEYVPWVGGWLQQAIRGGAEIGEATLVNFYTLHTTLVPVCLVLLMALHFWRVRKAGGVVLPRRAEGPTPGKPQQVLFLPNLLMRETAQGLAILAGVLVLATVFSAPLGDPANPGMSPNPAKPPWYFAGLQELLIHFHPLFAVVVLPLLAALALALIPYVVRDEGLGGAWLLSTKGRRMALLAACAGLVATPLWVVLDERVIDLSGWLPGLPPAISEGLLPFLALLAAIVAFHAGMRRRYDAGAGESAQATFVLLAVGLAALTAICIWFRGEGMALAWPWT
jgi:quinol-cytochrome oxidoreductase complex cytochrome b subunit